MRRVNLLFLLIFILLIIVVGIVFARGWNRKPIAGPSGEALPVHISYVTPKDGATISELDKVCAFFFFQAGNGLGDKPWTRIAFFIDNTNLSSQISWSSSLDIPPSFGGFCYQPPSPFSPGWHQGKFTYQDIKGNRFRYSWNFRVVPGTPSIR